ncbi:C-type lectin domain family 5 member A isoform X1 [Apodemus sylvaticus]|uniref:C-type lectin domain family 5 member A isoform X1 n=1 Tax=Apodemus sylvaticus TaxID=10129 RepID=UPI0022431744|nr:C-type lectin domain family 5 member A isoform X1 [Apodemus sylvaticus]XP_052029482.1 C-type lectin domain family 5 member A isoform X1 [Apodemus sylvaticus]
MNWHMIISGLIVVVVKVVGMTFFLLYFPQVFDKSNDGFIPTESYGTTSVQNVSQIFGRNDESFIPTRSYGTVCPKDWDFHQGRCFFFSTSESSWKDSRDYCATKGSTLAVVNTPEKLNFLQDIAGAENYFIGLIRQPGQKKWLWIDNSVFNGNVTNQDQNFDCVTIGLTKTFDAASCDVRYRWICEGTAK